MPEESNSPATLPILDKGVNEAVTINIINNNKEHQVNKDMIYLFSVPITLPPSNLLTI